MSNGNLPFVTNNRNLAIALHLGGAHIIGYWRTYTPQEEKSLGMPLAEAARRDIGGADAFFIEDTPEREALAKAFDETKQQVNAGKKVEIPEISGADAARLACLVLRLRRDISVMSLDPDRAKLVTSRGEVSGEFKKGLTVEGKEVALEGYTTHPGITVQSVTAPQAVKEKLNARS